MPTAKTIEDSISATLEWLDEVLRSEPSRAARAAAGEERFADVAASQLLHLVPAELRRRSTWSGYGGTAVARRLLGAFQDNQNWNAWDPVAALSVVEAAWAIAKSSGRRTPGLLFKALVSRAHLFGMMNRFDEAFALLDRAEEYAAETKLPRLHFALLAHHRAGVCYFGDSWREALEFIEQAREGYEACADARCLRYLRTLEASMWGVPGNFERARRVAEANLAEAIRSGDETVAAIEISNIGGYCVQIGDAAAARRYIGRALVSARARRWKLRAVQLQSLLGTLQIRERGIDGTAVLENACFEFDRLGMAGHWAEARLTMAEELLKVDPGADVRHLCEEAYTRATSLGRFALAERALKLLESL